MLYSARGLGFDAGGDGVGKRRMTDPVAYPKRHVPAGEDFLLLSPTAQAHAYRNVDRMFATPPIRRGMA
ncbi:MAG TPA: hypothetical protein VFP38_23705, partial [Bradyrhizobium sp.]|nr:hypothetical protein [Bradyrhizobium sp.]